MKKQVDASSYTTPRDTTFAHGAGFKTGLMAEAGPEAVMPLRRGTDGRLGVEAQGGGGKRVAQSITINEGDVNITEPNMSEAELRRVLAEHRREIFREITLVNEDDPEWLHT